MKTHHVSAWRSQRVAGLLLIAAGSTFLVDQMGIIDAHELWHYWPLLLILIGAVRMVAWRTAGDVTSGLWTIFIGAWLLANVEGWFGIDFRNSWPILLIAWGVTVLLKPVIARRVGASTRGVVLDKEENHDAS